MSELPTPEALARLQARFWRAIRAPETVDKVLPELAKDDPGIAPLSAWIRADDEGWAIERLNVYANMYFFRILGVVRDDYPKLLRLIGDDAFHNLVTGYLVACPSAHPSIRHVGSRMAEHLADHALARTYPAIADLARLEWERGLAFDGPDSSTLAADDLMAVPQQAWAELRFELSASLRRFELAFPAQKLWQALDREEQAPAVEPGTTRMLVWRRGFTVLHRASSVEESELLDMVADGVSFATLCEYLYRLHGDQAAVIAVKRLRTWIDQGLLSAIAS